MGQNHPAGLRLVDNSRLEEGIRVSNQRRGQGNTDEKICRREVRQPTASQGWILPTGMHGSESKTSPGVFGPHPLPKEAGKGDRHRGEYYIQRLHRRAGGGLGVGNPGCSQETSDRSR